MQIPSSGFPYWLFQALAIQNGANLMNAAGTQTYYDKPEVIEALHYWVDLVKKYKVHPEGIVEWGTTPKDFFEKKVAMMWTTTGNLTNVRTNAKFDFGVAMLPAGKQRGSPTGGGNFYLFKKATPAQREAAFKFIKWITTPQRAAQWGIDTGYVAVRADAWDTPAMKQYVAGFPAAAVARDQLPYRQGRAVDARQPARHQGAERRAAGGADRRQDARAGDEGRAARGRAAAAHVQVTFGRAARCRAAPRSRAVRERAMTRTTQWVYGWLLLLPAASLLALFTHYPAVATAWHSFFSTPKGARPAVFVGVDNYRQLVDDPIFWQSLANNLWYALGTIPVVDRAGAADGDLGQRPARRPRLPAPRLLHADDPADDRGRQHLALLLHARVRPARADHRRFGFASHNWLGSKNTALAALMVVAVWKEAGFFMIFYLAALQSMSPNLAEAAAIEGASRWYFFRRVTFPLLMPTTLFVLVNAVINAFRMVDHVVVMTRGGPDNATALLLYYIYEIGFRFWDTAYAAALTMVLLAILGAVALAQFWFLERRVHYQ